MSATGDGHGPAETRHVPGEPVGLGWPVAGALDPDGPGPEPAPDGVDVAATVDVSRETASGGGAGLGWAG